MADISNISTKKQCTFCARQSSPTPDTTKALERILEGRGNTIIPAEVNFVPLNSQGLNHWIAKRSADENIEVATRRRKRRRRRKKKTFSPKDVPIALLENKAAKKPESSRPEGLLRAKKIQAKQLKTESLKAKSVKADRIKSDTVISDVIVVTAKRKNPRNENPVEMRSYEANQSKNSARNRPLQRQSQSKKIIYRIVNARHDQPSQSKPAAYRIVNTRHDQPLNIDIHLPFKNQNSPSSQSTIPEFLLSGNNQANTHFLDTLQSGQTSSHSNQIIPQESRRSRKRKIKVNKNLLQKLISLNSSPDQLSRNEDDDTQNYNVIQESRPNFETIQNVPRESRRSRRRKSRVNSNIQEGLIGFKHLSEPSTMRLETIQGSQNFQNSKRSSFENVNGHSRKRSRSMDLSLQALDTPPVQEQSLGGSGLLRAKDIAANDIKTNSMTAKTITADHIRSKNVKARTLRVNDQAPAEMSEFFEVNRNQQIPAVNTPVERDQYGIRQLRTTSQLRSSANGDPNQIGLFPVKGFIKPTEPRYRVDERNNFAFSVSPVETALETDRFIQNANDRIQNTGAVGGGIRSRVKINPFVRNKSSTLERVPSLELLGISSTKQYPIERQMYEERPIKKQPIKYRFNSKFRDLPSENISQLVPRETSLAKESSSQMLDRVVLPIGLTEYISDNYRSFQKTVNSLSDPLMF